MIDSLKDASSHQPGVDERPAALLWADPRGEWRPLVPLLRERLPHLLTLGEYDVSTRTGPAIWLKCVIARLIEEIPIAADVVPVIYLPEMSRQDLRAGDECSALLQPFVELQYRGAVWTQKNGRDWTIEAFLVSDNALSLDVSRDASTRRSIDASLPVLAETPVSQLRGRRLEAEDFDRLVVGDHPRDLLTWMNSPADVQKRFQESGKWHAFRNRCRSDFGFDPDADGETVAGESFGLRDSDAWSALWQRFCESPGLYPSIPDLLIRSKPSGGKLLFDKEPGQTKTTRPSKRCLRDWIPCRPFRQRMRGLRFGRWKQNTVHVEIGFGLSLTDHRWLSLWLISCSLPSKRNRTSEASRRKRWLLFTATTDTLPMMRLYGPWPCGESITAQCGQDGVRALYLPWLEQSAQRLQDWWLTIRCHRWLSSRRSTSSGVPVCCLPMACGLTSRGVWPTCLSSGC